MAIIAILSSVGAAGLEAFRQTSILQQANGELISNLRSVQNSARNSTISQKLLSITGNVLTAKPAGFAIFFDSGGNYSMRYCTTQQLGGVTQYNCTNKEQDSLRSSTFNEISIASTVPSKCAGILFISGTADISALSSSVAAPDNTGTCTINTTLTSTGDTFRPIVVDLALNNFQI